MDIKQSITNKNPAYKENKSVIPTGLMLHSVGCAQPNAQTFIHLWNNPDARVAVHAVIDAITGDIFQALPWTVKGWHCGGNGNASYIGVEMCESNQIVYNGGSRFTVRDLKTAQLHATTAYNSAVNLFAFLCKTFNIKPNNIISHSEGHLKGIASNHSDPEHYWLQLQLPYTMDTFRKAVKEKMKGGNISNIPTPTIDNKNNASIIWNALKASGLNDFAVAGIMGNLQAESGLDPFNLQNTFNKKYNITDEQYTLNVDIGLHNRDMFISDKAGYGLAQWTAKTRKANMYDFIKSRGLSIGDLNGQVEFLIYELNNKFKPLMKELSTVNDLRTATELVLKKFEKPKDQSEVVLNKRLTNSQNFYKIFIKDTLYKVRRAWTEPNTQKGAFRNLENAIKIAKKHSYNVYDEVGNLIYKS